MKRLSLLAIILLGLMPCEAKVLSPEAAWQRAKAPEKGAPALAPAITSPVLARTIEKGGNPTVYVFNTNGGEGFCVVSADDLATPVLGYSGNGGFDADNMPPSLMGWLNDYSRIISYARENGMTVSGAPYVPSLKTIEPITKTKWNQDAPYNDQCPQYHGSPTVTGCVATAMAQVIKSYNYPARGKGSHSYEWINNNKEVLSLNFANITFDWANMTDTYNSSSTEAQKKAVSTLMMACGYASDMNYGTGASGTQTFNVGRGLVENFNYDPSLLFHQRDYYGIVDWMKLIHGELSLGRPVFYGGFDSMNGHAFVLDGYDATTGLVHTNWGWGGLSDGYYEIIYLNPTDQGIGGSSGGFAYNQTCFTGIQKPVAGHDYLPNMSVPNGICTNGLSAYTRKQNVSFLGGKGIFSYAIAAKDYTAGVKLVASNGSVSYVWSKTNTGILKPLEGWESVTIPASSFPKSGEYTVTMAYKSGNIIGEAPAPIGKVRKLKLTCTSSQIRFEPINDGITLKATAPIPLSDIYLSKRTVYKTTLSNTGNEYFGSLFIGFHHDSEEGIWGRIYSPTFYDIIAGQSLDLEFSSNPPVYSAGDYRIAVYTEDGTRISDFTNITVKETPDGRAEVRVDKVAIPNGAGGDGSQSNPFRVYTEEFTATGTLSCTKGFFDRNLRLYIYPLEGGTLITYLETNYYPLGAGSSTPVTASGSLTALSVGNTYQMVYNDGANNISDIYYLKVVGTNAGINDIHAEDNSCEISPNPVDDVMSIKASSAIKSASVYSLSGMLVKEFGFSGMSDHESTEVGDLARGHYIVKIVMANGKTLTRRMMKK